MASLEECRSVLCLYYLHGVSSALCQQIANSAVRFKLPPRAVRGRPNLWAKYARANCSRACAGGGGLLACWWPSSGHLASQTLSNTRLSCCSTGIVDMSALPLGAVAYAVGVTSTACCGSCAKTWAGMVQSVCTSPTTAGCDSKPRSVVFSASTRSARDGDHVPLPIHPPKDRTTLETQPRATTPRRSGAREHASAPRFPPPRDFR